MCANCPTPMPDEDAAKFMGMGLATVADEMERQNDMQVRLAALKLAVEVKGKPTPEGKPASSQDVLSSAHAYYNFITNKTKDANDK